MQLTQKQTTENLRFISMLDIILSVIHLRAKVQLSCQVFVNGTL